MAEILVKGKPWYYEATDYMTCGEHVLDHDDAAYIMLNAKKILEKKDIVFFPMYGTLLGMIRENGFIKGDHDMDLMIYGKDRQKLIDCIPDFYDLGIKFTRCSEPWVYTFIYKNAECDFYCINSAKWPYKYRYCLVCQNYMPISFFKEIEKYTFLGTEFTIPKNPIKILEYCYGKSWKTPIQGKAGRDQSKLLIHIVLWRFVKRVCSYINRHFLSKSKVCS